MFCCHVASVRRRGSRTKSNPNMEVTRENFESVLSTLPKIFQDAQFIAFDTEFTGLRVEGANGINYFDTLEDLYLKYRLRAETFMAIQIGFVAFFYDEKTGKYSHLAYNFYVYPSTYSDINFTCQSKSIQFLIEHGFDFNKVFKEGIPYLKEEEVEKLVDKLKEKYEKNYHQENAMRIDVPNEHKATVSGITNKIQDILNSNSKTSFTTEKYNGYIRKLIYNTVQIEFGSQVFLETNKDDSMTVSVGFTSEEIQEKQKEKFQMQKQKILDEVGFSKVIKLLIESKKLLIGHNLFLDILFIIKQFLAPLPNSYNECKELVMFLFPKIIDTKYMAAAEFKHFKDTSLNCLVEHFENSNSFPNVEVHEDGVGHSLKDKKSHEASYDAYLTGLCFLGMAEQLGKLNGTSNVFTNLPNSPILKSVLNKSSTPKLCDIFYMNLGGLDNEPDRLGVYHLTFPKDWTRENIMDLFKNCGPVNISWINSTSAFIKIKKEFIGQVERSLLVPNKTYQLLSHSDFKSSNSNSVDLLLSPLIEKRLGSTARNSQDGQTPVKSSTGEALTKRKIEEEDIGEVVERSKKKRRSK